MFNGFWLIKPFYDVMFVTFGIFCSGLFAFFASGFFCPFASWSMLKIISGGQTGVDQIALSLAQAYGLSTGGMAPKYYLTEGGSEHVLLKGYGLIESSTTDFKVRTHHNCFYSDATLLFGDISSAGSKATIKICRQFEKPLLINPTAAAVVELINKQHITILNIAGNRQTRLSPSHEENVKTVLNTTFQLYMQSFKV